VITLKPIGHVRCERRAATDDDFGAAQFYGPAGRMVLILARR
jgi:hypothetical protein